MASETDRRVRRAGHEDAAAVGRLLHEFNAEFDLPTPGAAFLGERIEELLGRDQALVLVVGHGPEGFALTRVRPSVWSGANEAYLEELYVVPDRRGEGLGKALLEATIEAARDRGCDRMSVATGETDTAARGLYERLGFRNTEGGPDKPAMLFYEREL